MSRLQKVKKNIAVGYLSQIVTAVASFLCRTIFIYELNAAYLGVNGLFSNILGILSLAELGFGVAMNYEMYKPVAEGDYAKVKALLKVYRKVYHYVAIFILVAGIALTPFLPVLVKDPGDIGNIYIYYVIYVVNTVVGYYATYLLSVTNAEQNEYISSLFSMGHILLANILEIVVLIVFKSFYMYLIVWLLATVIQQIALRMYFKKKYKYILEANDEPLDDDTSAHIKKNMGGLIVSKFCEVLLLQTDNIIIALGLNIITVGYADNYQLIINNLKKMMLSLLKGVVPSLGNMVALESQEKGYEVFRVYDFVDYLIYGVVTICLVVLFQPFMSLWAGSEKMIDYWSMIVLCLAFYIAGRSQSFLNYKTAYGIFYDMKAISVVAVIMNIGISVVGVFKLGLIGVYVGTCVAGLYQNVRILMISYNKITGHSCSKYLMKRAYQVLIIIPPILLVNSLSSYFSPEVSLLRWLLFAAVTTTIAAAWILVIYWSSFECRYIRNLVANEMHRLGERLRG